jgi:hypothetical protein
MLQFFSLFLTLPSASRQFRAASSQHEKWTGQEFRNVTRCWPALLIIFGQITLTQVSQLFPRRGYCLEGFPIILPWRTRGHFAICICILSVFGDYLHHLHHSTCGRALTLEVNDTAPAPNVPQHA